MPANFSKTPKKPKNSDDLLPRDHRGEERSRQRLAAALDRGDQNASTKKCQVGRHEVAEDADDDVDDERDEDRRLRADAAGQPAEEKRERDADELHEHERRDQRVLRQPDLLAVDRRHPDDRADAVVVDQERHQHQERLAVPPQLAQRRDELTDGRRQRVHVRRPAADRTAGSGTRRNRGIEKTSHQTATLRNESREARRRRRRGRTTRGFRIHAQVDAPAAARRRCSRARSRRSRRDRSRRRGDVRQQRVVEDEAAGDADVGDDEERRASNQSPRADEEHAPPCQRRRSPGRRPAAASWRRRSRRRRRGSAPGSRR